MSNIFREKKIMVPIDFTPVTDNALSYADSFAKIFNNEILLMHVADKNSHAEAERKLKEKAENNESKTGIRTTISVVDGNIFDHIGETAIKSEAALVVMGTHGIKGMQKFMGSYALRVISNSKGPFIVTQNKSFEDINNILIPVDFSMEVKQVLIFAEEIAKQFHATVHLLSKPVSDEWLLKKVQLNLQYAREFFEDSEISVKVIDSHTSKDFQKDTVKAALTSSSNLIVILVDPDVGLADFILGSYEQKLIANEAEIPVMCINMKTVKFSSMARIIG